jgi:hypothetical protein
MPTTFSTAPFLRHQDAIGEGFAISFKGISMVRASSCAKLRQVRHDPRYRPDIADTFRCAKFGAH